MKIRIRKLPQILEDTQKVKQAVRYAVKRAGERYLTMVHEWIDAKKAFTPRTGHLQRSIQVRFTDNASILLVNAEYASFVEYGTRPHTIFPRNRKALKIPTRDGYIFRRKVQHPGSKPYPYFFADFENRKRAVYEEFRQAFLEGLQ